MRNITNWETGRRFLIYPPPEIPPPSNSIDSSTKNNLVSTIQTSPESEKRTTGNIHASPSHIPDSQPNTPPQNLVSSVLDLSCPTPTCSPKGDGDTSVHVSSPQKPMSRVYQSSIPPPRAESLESVHLSPPQNSPAPTDCSICTDRLPSKFPLFTSTPKSKPLKRLLPESVSPFHSL